MATMGFPGTLRGWGDYLLTIGVPIMVGLALKDRIFAIADNIYDGRNGA